MRRLLISGIVLLSITAVVATSLRMLKKQPGPLTIEPALRLLGTIGEHDKPTIQVQVTNKTDADVDINKLVLCCGCMSSDFKSQSLDAHESMTFAVQLNSLPPGDLRLHGEVLYGPSELEKLRFEIRGKVEALFRLDPETNIFSNLPLDGTEWPHPMKLTVTTSGESPFVTFGRLDAS